MRPMLVKLHRVLPRKNLSVFSLFLMTCGSVIMGCGGSPDGGATSSESNLESQSFLSCSADYVVQGPDKATFAVDAPIQINRVNELTYELNSDAFTFGVAAQPFSGSPQIKHLWSLIVRSKKTGISSYAYGSALEIGAPGFAAVCTPEAKGACWGPDHDEAAASTPTDFGRFTGQGFNDAPILGAKLNCQISETKQNVAFEIPWTIN